MLSNLRAGYPRSKLGSPPLTPIKLAGERLNLLKVNLFSGIRLNIIQSSSEPIRKALCIAHILPVLT